MQLDDVTEVIVGTAILIHKRLGPGLLESVYEIVLARALDRAGLHVARQPSISFTFVRSLNSVVVLL